MQRYGLKNTVSCLVLLVATAQAVAQVQQAQPVPTSLPTTPYADYTFGFEMRIPAGWTYDRTRFMGPGGAVGLLRGAVESATLQILVFPKAESVTFIDWLQHFETQLAGISGTRQIVEKERKIGERVAAVLDVDAHVGGRQTKTYYLCIPFSPRQIWVFSYAATVAAADEPGPTRAQFEQLCKSVRVLYDPEQAREMTASFARGQTLLKRLIVESADVRVSDAERFYEIVVNGKPLGFLTRRVVRESRSLDDPRFGKRGRPGMRVHEESWRFIDDGGVHHVQVDLFSSFDLRTELIETRTTQIPAPDAASQRLFITLDQCVRERDLLFSSYSTNLDSGLPEPRAPIQVGQTYLSLSWIRLLPAVLGKTAGPTHSFAVYDPATRALSTSTIRPLGPRASPIDPQSRAYAFEMSEGFAEQKGLLLADDQGLLLRYEAGELLLRLTSRETVEHRWGARQKAALERMKSRPR